MRMAKQKSFCCFLCFLSVILWSEQVTMGKVIIRVGVVLDMNSAVGKTAENCISAAANDFYARNADYRTRISLVTRDSKGDVVTAASAGTTSLNIHPRNRIHDHTTTKREVGHWPLLSCVLPKMHCICKDHNSKFSDA
jgi:hypothetical protein